MTTLEHLSEQPWSNYTKSDYTTEQWHRACLIHQHQGAPTSKSQCKLPVKTPDGTVNRNGVHAAAAALGGARGGVQASPDEISSAKTALGRLYSELGEDKPDSLNHSGVKGMKWGVRKETSGVISRRSSKPAKEGPSEDAVRVVQLHTRVKAQRSTRPLSNHELETAIKRMNLEQQYSRLSGGNDKTAVQKGRIIIKDFLQSALKTNISQAFNSQVKDKMDQRMQQGRYDPIAVAERENKARKIREQQQSA